MTTDAENPMMELRQRRGNGSGGNEGHRLRGRGRGGGYGGRSNGVTGNRDDVKEADMITTSSDVLSSSTPKSFPPFPRPDSSQKSFSATKITVPPALSTPTSALWHLSRTSDSTYRSGVIPPGQDRAITLFNIRLSFSLARLLWIRFLGLFLSLSKMRMMVYLGSRLIKGILPTFKVWANASLLDLVQESFSTPLSTPIDQFRIIRLALLSLFASTSSTLFQHLTSTNDLIVQQNLDHQIEKMYLAGQLSLDIPTLSDPYIDALMYEAGAFAGFESRQRRPVAAHGGHGGRGPRAMTTSPFQALNKVVNLATGSVEVISAGALLLNTLRQATKDNQSTAQHHLPWPFGLIPVPSGSIILIILSFLPALLSILGTFSLFSMPTTRSISRNGRLFNWQAARREEREIKDLGRNGGYKQEVVLFELKDWVMKKWEEVRLRQIEDQMKQREMVGLWGIGFSLGQETLQTSFYTLLALRSFGTSISLGSIRLYQNTADSLVSSLRSMTNNLADCVQIIFYMAAFFEAMEIKKIMDTKGRRGLLLLSSASSSSTMAMGVGPHQAEEKSRPDLIDYETTRMEGGMRIEARNLSFTYPGMKNPVLRNINLVVEPGTTLAIVGFNGGGKTTLVKVLMSLYDFQEGELLINGHPAEAFPPSQLHNRTSCAFQDHSKYSLTLRENVGIGNVSLIDSIPDIEMALRKGGAEALEKTIGLEGMLDRYGVPDQTGRDDGDGGRDQEEMDMPEPPPDMHMRGGGRGRGGRGGGMLGGLGGGSGRGGFSGPPPGGFPPMNGMPFPPPGMEGMPPPAEMNGMPPPGMMMPGFGGPGQVKEDKHPLSGGQWQRIALARAWMRAEKADLVVFDEPSAALDARAESELFKRIHALSEGADGKRTTTIYISHRFSTVKKADKIAVVEEGTISEFGSHDELMKKRGRYHELFQLQKEGFE